MAAPERRSHTCAPPPCSSTDGAGRTVLDSYAAPPELFVTCPSVPWIAARYVLSAEHAGRPVWTSLCGGKCVFASSGGRWMFGERGHMSSDRRGALSGGAAEAQGCVQSQACRAPIGPHHVGCPEVRARAEAARRHRAADRLFRAFDWDADGFLSYAEAAECTKAQCGYALTSDKFTAICSTMGMDPEKGWSLQCLQKVLDDDDLGADVAQCTAWHAATTEGWRDLTDLEVSTRVWRPPARLNVLAPPVHARRSPLAGEYTLSAQTARGWPLWQQSGGCVVLCSDEGGRWVFRTADTRDTDGSFASTVEHHGGRWPQGNRWQVPADGGWKEEPSLLVRAAERPADNVIAEIDAMRRKMEARLFLQAARDSKVP
eukprot:TRINITY_DN10006_c1_g1_i3.p1 TRINITY_DN10006_c1_g1~~TRINITY_DN10006_c1_g1_i3.p1  ORF type:complete len:391 (+),score=67.09 TRINITY_DN10006_c1_g1_i3:56-1174(+)